MGKTSLVKFLARGTSCNPNEPKSQGVKHERVETSTWPMDASPFKLNIWDFAGQRMTHETHKYFLTERSLYLIVLQARKEDRSDEIVTRWLRTVANRAGEAPVIVVINKADPPDGQPDAAPRDLIFNETGLKAEFPQIVGFVRTSCSSTYKRAGETIAGLRTLIQQTLATHPHLAQSREPFASAYRRVREELETLKSTKQIIGVEDFVRICERANGDDGQPLPERLRVTDPAEQRTLLRLMHELGVVIAHGLRADSSAAARAVTLLDPNWLTGAIYALIEHPKVRDQHGEFSRAQLPELLDQAKYDQSQYEYILDMMDKDDFGLCIELPGKKGHYLIPERLGGDQPDLKRFAGGLRFRVAYAKGLPKGLMPRFIVESHENLSTREFRWQTGVVLRVPPDGGCEVAVWTPVEHPDRVELSAIGPDAQRRSALGVAVNYLRIVNSKNKASEPAEYIPWEGNPDVAVRYDYLLNLEEKRRGTGNSTFDHPGPDGKVLTLNMAEMLDGLEGLRRPMADARRRQDDMNPDDFSDRSAGVVIKAGPNSNFVFGDFATGTGRASVTQKSNSAPQPGNGDESSKGAAALLKDVRMWVAAVTAVGAGALALVARANGQMWLVAIGFVLMVLAMVVLAVVVNALRKVAQAPDTPALKRAYAWTMFVVLIFVLGCCGVILVYVVPAIGQVLQQSILGSAGKP